MAPAGAVESPTSPHPLRPQGRSGKRVGRRTAIACSLLPSCSVRGLFGPTRVAFPCPRPYVAKNRPIHIREDALQLGLAAEHGAAALETPIHRERWGIEPPALESGQLGGIGFDLLLDQVQQAQLVGVEALPAELCFKGGAARLGQRLVCIHKGPAGFVDRHPLAGGRVDLVMDIKR